MVDAIEIGYVIKDRRAELGLTQAQLAKTAGISKRCLWSLELGLNPGVQLNKLTMVLGALGLDLVISAPGAVESSECVEEDAADVVESVPRSATSASSSDKPMAGNGNAIDVLAILTEGRR